MVFYGKWRFLAGVDSQRLLQSGRTEGWRTPACSKEGRCWLISHSNVGTGGLRCTCFMGSSKWGQAKNAFSLRGRAALEPHRSPKRLSSQGCPLKLAFCRGQKTRAPWRFRSFMPVAAHPPRGPSNHRRQSSVAPPASVELAGKSGDSAKSALFLNKTRRNWAQAGVSGFGAVTGGTEISGVVPYTGAGV